jgi:Zn-dependent M28 family amino/carboxypeptidase
MHRNPSTGRLAAAAIGAAALVASLALPATAGPANPDRLAEQLVRKADGADANRHLVAFQRIADRNGGNRAANTPGYDASVDYVARQLRQAGFKVSTPEFTYEEEVAVTNEVRLGSATFVADKLELSPLTPVGGVTAPLRAVADLPGDATPGCETTDFDGQDFTGTIAVIRRGGCNFSVKRDNAAAEGAVGVIIANNTAGPLTNVTLGTAGTVPVGGVSQADGTTLIAAAGQTATLELVYEDVTRTQRNVIAQTRTGRTDNVVMAGAHLDSVEVGPGINDNGTGTAGLLEVALEMGGSPSTRNAIRFGFWGAEELGLIGSTEYVQSLSFEQQLDIALYLNFDMIGSPNAAYFVYDGDDSDAVGAGAGPFGSAQIEDTFTDFFAERLEVPTEGTDFSGRSDYGEFIAVGIPAGGLFTGAEGVKTAEQAAKWGGTAGTAYDPCYHAACDNLGNVDRTAFDRNIDAMAWAIGKYALSTADVNGVQSRQQRATLRGAAAKTGLTAVEPHSHEHHDAA